MMWAGEESDATCDHGMPSLSCLTCTSAEACAHGMPPALCLQCNAPSANALSVMTTAKATPPQPQADGPFRVARGQLTFDAEGTEGGTTHSRRAHWPRAAKDSGVTIGRGYDMKQRTKKSIISDLTSVGVSLADAQLLSEGAGMAGEQAGQFVARADVFKIQITPQTQKNLFLKVYDKFVVEIKEIFDKKDTLDLYKKHGIPDWETLHPALKDILVDLTYRGDYYRETRASLQPLIIKNDLQGMFNLLSDRAKMKIWGVPDDRIDRRIAYLEKALKEEKLGL